MKREKTWIRRHFLKRSRFSGDTPQRDERNRLLFGTLAKAGERED